MDEKETMTKEKSHIHTDDRTQMIGSEYKKKHPNFTLTSRQSQRTQQNFSEDQASGPNLPACLSEKENPTIPLLVQHIRDKHGTLSRRLEVTSLGEKNQ